MKHFKVQMLSFAPRGGFHHYSSLLCNALSNHAEIESVDYLCVYREQEAHGVGNEEGDLIEPPVHTHFLAPAGLHSMPAKYGIFLRNLARYLMSVRRHAFDVIHIQTGTYNQVFNLALLCWFKMTGVSVVRTVAEMHMAERGTGLSPLQRRLALLELRLTDHLIVHDTYIYDRLGHALNTHQGRLTVIPHGNYMWARKHMPRGADDHPGSQNPTLLFWGVKRHKGLEIFLQAWRMLQEEGYHFQAILAGTVHDDSAGLLEMAGQLPGIEVNASYIPNEQIWRYMCRSAAVVAPYLSGTTSGTTHLAFAFKRPVIASDLDCFKDMVIPDQTGIIVPRGNVVALKEAMIRLCKDTDLCRRMGEEGFRLASEPQYSWETIARQTVGVYQKLALD
jgi:glycosyltransferase involved in cell wall biosynthesis